MDDKHKQWIVENVAETYGTCAEITLGLAEKFPDLKRVRGHYYCPTWGERAHWWLVDKDGQIVDPTASQFPSGGAGVYVSWEEGSREPTGTCPQCGDYVYDGGTCCSESCHSAYVAYCMNPW